MLHYKTPSEVDKTDYSQKLSDRCLDQYQMFPAGSSDGFKTYGEDTLVKVGSLDLYALTQEASIGADVKSIVTRLSNGSLSITPPTADQFDTSFEGKEVAENVATDEKTLSKNTAPVEKPGVPPVSTDSKVEKVSDKKGLGAEKVN